MFNRNRIFAGARIALLLTLILGLVGTTPAAAQVNREMSESDTSTIAVQIHTPAYPVPINSEESKLVPFSIAAAEGISGALTDRTYQFFTQYDVPLSEPFGPFPASVSIDSSGTASWNELVYLPGAVANEARAIKDYAIVLRSTFNGRLQTGERFSANSSVLLLLPPDAFSKVSPSNGAIVQPGNRSLQWNSSVGAVDYEYCFDSIDNESCDSNWTGTYWLGTYDTNATLQNLPPGTTVYWQVRANNTSGTTYADNGDWWEFTTATSTIYVNWNATGTNDGTSWENAYTDLQSALAAASSGSEIWVAAGTYKPTSGTDRTVSFVMKNNVAMYGGFAGMEVSLDQRDPATNVTILSGDIGVANERDDNSFHVVTGGNLDSGTVLDGFTITAGNSPDVGGGVFLSAASPTLQNLIISGNTAIDGGGMFMHRDSRPTLTDVVFSGNTANTVHGGGGGLFIAWHNDPILERVTFTGNTTNGLGGGIYHELSEARFSDVVFTENQATAGAGMYGFASDIDIYSATFAHNVASTIGGGINQVGGILNITNATFSGNRASYGGGLYLDQSTVALTNATLHGNTGTTSGGAIFFYNGSSTVRNSILWNNTGGEIVNTGASVSYSIVQGGYTGTGNIDADPLLGPLQDNGGFTQTIALQLGSPAIDAGNPENCPPTDQRGVTRPQGNGCDIGAYEYVFPPTPTPTRTATAGGKPTKTNTPSRTPSPTLTSTPITPTATHTFTPHPPTITFTPSSTVTSTPVVGLPANISKGFSPTVITSGGTSRLSVSIFNPNPFALTNAGLTDNLPAGITIANPAGLSTSCGGTITAAPGGTSLLLTGGSIPAQAGSTPGSCTMAINVTSSTPGNFTNTIPAGALATDQGITNSTSASATLTVLPSTATASATATRTATAGGKPTKTSTPSRTPTWTITPSPTLSPTTTEVSVTPTFTFSPSPTTSSGFPTTVVRDNFDRANGAIGNNWFGNPSAFTIASNQLDVTASGSNTFILWKSSSFGADQEAYVTLTQIDAAAGNEQRLILKSQNSKNVTSGLISVQYDAAGQTVQVWTYHPTQGWVQHGVSIPVTFMNGDQFGARARPDGSVEVYRNGTLVGTWNITSWPFYNSGGYIGLWLVNAPNALLDNFGGGTR